MSSFECNKCGKICLDSARGFATGCEHYPADFEDPCVPMSDCDGVCDRGIPGCEKDHDD